MEDVEMQVEEPPIVSFHASAGRGALAQGASPVEGSAHALAGQQVHVRMARSNGRRDAANVLARKMYAWRGYAFSVDEEAAANQITLYAEAGGELVGTMSLWLDRQNNLPADNVFGDRLELLRRQGRRLCEPSRLAIDRGASKRVFAALIHTSYIYAHHVHGFSDYVIEVNPRHVGFYKHMLGFADFGAERECARVGAPAVLLRLPLDHMGTQIRRWGGSMGRDGGERSFYPWFFAPSEEPGIVARLSAGHVQENAA
jgi:hypothetical protein